MMDRKGLIFDQDPSDDDPVMTGKNPVFRRGDQAYSRSSPDC